MIHTNAYATTNVTTSAYVTLVASLSESVGALLIVDTSTALMKLAVGAVGAEEDLFVFQGNGNAVYIQQYIAKGKRLSLKAISASATTGYNAISFLG